MRGYEEIRYKVPQGPRWWAHAWSPSLPHRCRGRGNIPAQVAHPFTGAIAFYRLDFLSNCPCIEHVWEIHSRVHSVRNACIEPRIDLHQVRLPGVITPELHQRISFQPDFPD